MTDIVEIIAKLSSKIVKMEEDAREQFDFKGLTFNQMRYLETIRTLGNPNLTELAHALGLTKPTVTVAVEKLIEKEYVIKVQSDEDRRSAHLHLTEKGDVINQVHDLAHKRMAEEMSRSLTPEEFRALISLLEKVAT